MGPVRKTRQLKAAPAENLVELAGELVDADMELVEAQDGARAALARLDQANERLEKAQARHAAASAALVAGAGGAK